MTPPEPPEPSDSPDPPAEGEKVETREDVEEIEPDPRFSYANERTFLAWIRTALGLITAGLVVTQLFPGFDVPGGRRMIGLPLIGLGVLIALFSYTHWQRNEVAMRRGEPLPGSFLPRLVAVVVSIVAVVGFVLVVVEGITR
jgi:putative membrane protein